MKALDDDTDNDFYAFSAQGLGVSYTNKESE